GIIEEIMLDLMYDLPSQSAVKDFTVTRAMVEEHIGGKVLPLPGTDHQKTA
ncbi:ATP-dependent Clp protease ATP-binding subunit ClpX, partial [bacterium]|nr:ATP-dependent Clp protease ATP-binding subunit ClpX [bacterium]